MSVARLQVGQRVFVEHDAFANPVGAWGTVIRERWNMRGGAWVRLDERHKACPFPPDVADRATWILTAREVCSSCEPEPAPAPVGFRGEF